MEALFRILLVLLATAEDNAIGSQAVSKSHQEQYWRAKAASKNTNSHLYSCEQLCKLCLQSSPSTDCRRSMDELTANCGMRQPQTLLGQPRETNCTGKKRQYCRRHLTIVEHFLRSKRGYWCRLSGQEPTDEVSLEEGADDNFADNELLRKCLKFLGSRNFWMLNNQNQQQQCPSHHFQDWLPPIERYKNGDPQTEEVKRTQDLGEEEETKGVTPQNGLVHRTTRSPVSNVTDGRIKKWKMELSTELAQFSRVLPSVSCNSALHDLCLSHISCRELWKLFRQSCIVDAQNQCQMINRNDCWQSFEGISWTGLGTCTCFDNNSDCHWIRLQTNYNKCIYEISISGEMGPAKRIAQQHHSQLGTPLANGNYPATAPPSYHQRYYFTSTPATAAPAATTTSTAAPTTLSSTPVNVRWQQQQSQPKYRNWDDRSEYAKRQDEEDRKQRLAQEMQKLIEEERRREEQKKHQELYQQRLQEHRNRQQASLRHQEQLRRQRLDSSRQQSSPYPQPQQRDGQWSRPKAPEPANQHLGYTIYNNRTPKKGIEGGSHLDIYTLVKPSPTPTAPSMRVRVTHHTKLQPTEGGWTAGGLKTTPYESLVTAIQKPPTVVGPTKAYPEEQQVKTTTTSTTPIPSTSTTPVPSTATTSTSATTTTAPVTTTATTFATDLAQKSSKSGHKSDDQESIVVSRKSPLRQVDNEDERGGSEPKESTCQTAYKKCEESETCRWHLSELQIKCPLDHRHCHSEHCAKAVGRFTRYVSKPMVESLMFCQCSFGDGECKHLHQWMFPQCLYLAQAQKPKWTCTQTMKLCQSDAICRRHMGFFNASCQVHPFSSDDDAQVDQADNGDCISKDLSECRMAVILARGSYLETPCYCGAKDLDCLNKQNLILPNNPCLEMAMLDYYANPLSSSSDHTSTSSVLAPRKVFRGSKTSNVETDVKVLSHTEQDASKKLDQQENNSGTYQEHISRYKSPYSTPKSTAKVMEESLPNTTDSLPTTSAFYTQQEPEEEIYGSSETEKYLTENYNETSIEGASMENSTISSRTTLDPAVKQALLKKMNQRKQFRPAKYFLPTGEYVTQRPPPEYGGCTTRNIDGEWIVHYKDSLFRQYHDWSGVCSSWCQCTTNETINCHALSCLSDVLCEALHTTVRVGERLYLEGRGACLCQSGRFICDTSEELLDLRPGLYISLGYSKEELQVIKEKVPKPLLEKCGLVSPMGSVAKDIASRMQFALERVLPKETKCRIAVLEHFPLESVIILQLQWYGIDRAANETQARWHVGKLEKQCSPYVRELEYNFLLEKSDRYQLVLSTVKQVKVVDLLDGLAPSALLSAVSSSGSICKSLVFVSSWLWTALYTLCLICLYINNLWVCLSMCVSECLYVKMDIYITGD